MIQPTSLTPASLEIDDLMADPREEWQRMLRFCQVDDAALRATMPSVEPLLRRAPETVAGTYDYLSHFPETAAVLGWEQRVDAAHLEERRRFFAVWLSRTLAFDRSDEFALYLFKAGKYHAAHGPRQIHTPETWITGSIGLMLSAFATQMGEAGLSGPVISAAMSAWSRYLSAQLHLMTFGYRIAVDLTRGAAELHCTTFGRLRPLVERTSLTICTEEGAPARSALRKFFNYFPAARAEALERVWRSDQPSHSSWVEVRPSYLPRYGWRVLLNGRELEYAGGFEAAVHNGDELSIFPPGR